MEHVQKKLQILRKDLHKQTGRLKAQKIKTSERYEVVFAVLEEMESRVFLKYALDITRSFLTGSASSSELHKRLTKIIEDTKKTKEIVNEYIKISGNDPITEEYLMQVIERAGFVLE